MLFIICCYKLFFMIFYGFWSHANKVVGSVKLSGKKPKRAELLTVLPKSGVLKTFVDRSLFRRTKTIQTKESLVFLLFILIRNGSIGS